MSKEQFPLLKNKAGGPLPEIAIVGRSNVGKSTLINHLLQNKNLAKTSATPGKTQAINFFIVDEVLTLVDLPGYGYAQISHELKKKWSALIDAYFATRSSLSLILFLIDIRRTPTEQDLDFLRWSAFHKKPVLILFTKSDKVNTSEKQKNVRKSIASLQEILSGPAFDYMLYSIKSSDARKELIARLNTILLEVYGSLK